MGEVSDWNVAAASNNSSPPAGAPEAMAASAVNDTMREMMARVKRWYVDISGVTTTGGSSNAYTLSASQTISAYAAGQAFLCVASFANTESATFNVDSVGAKTIKKYNDVNLASGDIEADMLMVLAYDANADVFQLLSPVANAPLVSADLGSTVQAYDADILKADTADTLTKGFDVTAHNAGTKGSGTFTPDPADGNFQYAVNGGAHTLAPPESDCTIVIQYTNNASAGAITVSSFTKTETDEITTTDGDDFLFYITRCNSKSFLVVKALQ